MLFEKCISFLAGDVLVCRHTATRSPVFFAADQPGTAPVLYIFFLIESNDRIIKYAEVGTGDIVYIKGRCACCQMTAGRETHHADLLDAPLCNMSAAVAEYELDVIQGHSPVAIGHTVLCHSHGDAALEQPFSHIEPFAIGTYDPVTAARADYHHLAIGVFGEIYVKAGCAVDFANLSEVPLHAFWIGDAALLLDLKAEAFYILGNNRIVDGRNSGFGIVGIEEYRLVGHQICPWHIFLC